jgi:uncharacterized membrane protein
VEVQVLFRAPNGFEMKLWLVLHLITIGPVLILGPFILFRKKGTDTHKILGKLWAVTMIASCLFSFGVQSEGRLTWLHGLATFTIFSVIRAIIAIRNGQLKIHQRAMWGSYIGAATAFIFAAAIPNRLIGGWIYGLLH